MNTLASITTTERGATDRLLKNVVTQLQSKGVRIQGALLDMDKGNTTAHCECALRLLPDGPVIRITQDLGIGSTACKMDAGALEDVVGILISRLASEKADLLVLNKFGLREAEGHGFRALIGKAQASGIPVLLGVSNTHSAAFETFADGLATKLMPNESAIIEWCMKAIAPSSPQPKTNRECL